MTTCDLEKLRAIFDRGLTVGVGNRHQTCIEGAISLACGGDLADFPPCVAGEDGSYSLEINDSPHWTSPQARAEALWPLALAQIGTAGRDRRTWVAALARHTIRLVVPYALRVVAWRILYTQHARRLCEAADRCEREPTEENARAAAYAAHDAVYAAAYAARAAHDAADAAADAATRATYAAADAAADAAARAAHAAADAAADSETALRLSIEAALLAYAETDGAS